MILLAQIQKGNPKKRHQEYITAILHGIFDLDILRKPETQALGSFLNELTEK